MFAYRQRLFAPPLGYRAVDVIVVALYLGHLVRQQPIVSVERYQARRVLAVHCLHPFGDMQLEFIAPVDPSHLVFDAPENNAGMISVAADKANGVSAAALEILRMCGIHTLAGAVYRSLVDYEHSDLVCYIEIVSRVRLGMQTNVVYTVLPTQLVPVQRILLGHLYRPLKVPRVAAQIYRLAVEDEFCPLRPYLAKAESLGAAVEDRAAADKLGAQPIQLRMVRVPVLGIRPSADCLPAAAVERQHGALAVEHLVMHPRSVRSIRQLGQYGYLSAPHGAAYREVGDMALRQYLE